LETFKEELMVEKKRKYCPILLTSNSVDENCDDGCAWYDPNNKCCIIQTLAKNLSNIKVSIAR